MPTKNKVYDNFYLENEVENMYASNLDMLRFAEIDNTLEGEPGMTKKIHRYIASDGTQKLGIGEGNTKSISVSYADYEYKIQLAQNRFEYYDEEAMTDPMIVPVGMQKAGIDMFNTVNDDVFGEYKKTSNVVYVSAYNFDAFVDAAAALNVEDLENIEIFGFVNPTVMGEIRKNLGESLKYVESFARQGYVGTVAGINLYTKRNADAVIIGVRSAVKVFNKKGVSVEQIGEDRRGADDANVRLNTVFSRKYYVAALVDETKAIKIVKGTRPFGAVTVAPVAQSASIFEVPVSDLQGADVAVNGNAISGTLKYHTGSDAITDVWGEGYFLCLDWTNIDEAHGVNSLKVGLDPTFGSGLVEAIEDPDHNGIFKIGSKDVQEFVAIVSDGTNSIAQRFTLFGVKYDDGAEG